MVDVTGTLDVLSDLTLQAGEIDLASGATLIVNTLADTGQIVGSGAVVVQGSVDTAALEPIIANHVSVQIAGTLNNSGHLLSGTSIDLGQAIEIDGGTLNSQGVERPFAVPDSTLVLNGVTANGGEFWVPHVTLDNVTIANTVTIEGSLTIENGLTFAPSSSASPSVLVLDGYFITNGDFTLPGSIAAHGSIDVAGTLTIPAGVVLQNDISVTNDIVDGTSAILLAGGTLVNDGTIISINDGYPFEWLHGGEPSYSVGGIHYDTASIENDGLIEVSTDTVGAQVFHNTSAGTIAFDTPSASFEVSGTTDFINDGIIDATYPGAFDGIDSIVFEGSVAGSGTILIGGSNEVVLDTVISNSQTIDFKGAGFLRIPIPQFFGSPIERFAAGDTIAATGTLTGLSYTSGDLKLLLNGSTADLDVTGAYTLQDFTFQQQGGTTYIEVSDSVSCFVAGTRIAVPDGQQRRVEDLAAGDPVLTRSGATRPIRWIGTRAIDIARHPKPYRVSPVEISADAFGPGLPRHAIRLSPDHAVLVDGVLIPIGRLCNGTTIRRIEVQSVTYYHVELDSHDILLAEGLPVESYLDAGERGNFINHDGAIRLIADFAPRVAEAWEVRGCAPIVVTGARLDAVRRRLAAAA